LCASVSSVTLLSRLETPLCIAVVALWTFMWFVCFCFLCDTWRRTAVPLHKPAAEAAIAFSFFSIAIFVSSTEPCCSCCLHVHYISPSVRLFFLPSLSHPAVPPSLHFSAFLPFSLLPSLPSLLSVSPSMSGQSPLKSQNGFGAF